MYVNASKNEISVNKLLLPTEINGVPFDVKLIFLICDGQNFNIFLPRKFDVSILVKDLSDVYLQTISLTEKIKKCWDLTLVA